MTVVEWRWATVLLSVGAFTVTGCVDADSGAADLLPIDSTGPAIPSTDSTTTTMISDATTISTTTSTTANTTTMPAPLELRLNQVQMLGSHNSFHLVPEPTLFAGIEAVSADLARDIEYSHRTLTEQLADFGIRQFELDVFADPTGGLYSSRAANVVVGLAPESADAALDAPGFKVLHTQDFDYETTCPTLVACLSEIDTWSREHPEHLPIMILIELKDLSVPEAAAEEGLELTIDLPWAQPVETTGEVLAALDIEVRSAFGLGRLFEPDELRDGALTLAAAIGDSGWPTIETLRGRVIVALNDTGDQRDLYTTETPVLEGRPMFTSSTPGAPDAAFVRFDDPFDPGLDEAAAAGYLIRTRTDSPTVDARSGDTSRRDAALLSGAHFLSTDYYEPSSFFDSPYVVALPGGVIARCNPVTAPPACRDDLLGEP
ncbi:MAG: hypothetical protein GKR86_05210 [Ilumatobacter sp.]|nr:hypothetical protein [Ilumatobacter sp.]